MPAEAQRRLHLVAQSNARATLMEEVSNLAGGYAMSGLDALQSVQFVTKNG
jgi:hypothetical protein